MAVANNVEKPKKSAKPSFNERMNEMRGKFGYFREVWLELKKVHWPTKDQLLTYTAVVLVSVGILSVLIWIVDSFLSYLMTLVLGG